MPLATCPRFEDLSALQFGTLSASTADEVAEHLDECPDCQATIASIDDSADSLVSSLRQPPAQESFENEPELARALAAVEALGAKLPPPVGGAQDAPPAAREQLLGTLREYQLLEELGEGGMGTVYKARHAMLKRIVAVKVLPRDRTRDAQAILRFQREMEAVGKLEHPNIVRALDAGEHNGTHYLVMEFIDGLDLSKLVQRCGKLPIADACDLVRQAAVALQHAYEHGMVHRDIKPSNLMLTAARAIPTTEVTAGLSGSANSGGQVKLLDLGLALLGGPQSTAQFLTVSNQMMGTADFIAPEQVGDSHAVDIRADIYSLGCTLYKLLTGEAPFSGAKYGSSLQKMLAHRREPIPPVTDRRPDVPGALVAVLDRMVAKQPSDRFATPAEVAAALAPFCAGSDLAALSRRAGGVSPPVESVAIATAKTDEFLSNSMTGTHPSVGQAFQPDACSPSPVPGSHSSPPNGLPPRRVLIAAAAAASLVFLAGIVVIIKNRAGETVAQVNVPDGGGAEIRQNDQDIASIHGNGSKPTTVIEVAAGSTATIVIDKDEKQAVAPELPLEIKPLHRVRWPDGDKFCATDVSVDGRYFLAVRNSPPTRERNWHVQSVRIWNTQTAELVREIGDVLVARFTPDGKEVVCSNWGVAKTDYFRVYDIATGELVRQFGGGVKLWVFYLSQTGTRLLNYHDGHGLQVWDWSTGKKLSNLPWTPGDPQLLMPDGRHLLRQQDGKPPLVVLDTETGKPVEAFPQLLNLPRLANLSPDGKRLLCRDERGLKVFDFGTGKKIAAMDSGFGPDALDLANLISDGRLLIAPSSERDAFGVWEVDSGLRVANLRFPETLAANVTYRINPHARCAVFTLTDSVYVFRLPDLLGGSKAKSIVDKAKEPAGNPADTQSPPEKAAAKTEPDPIEIQRFVGHRQVYCVASVTADGNKLLTPGWDDRTVRLWDVASGREVGRWQTGAMAVDAAVSPDGQRVAWIEGGPGRSELMVADAGLPTEIVQISHLPHIWRVVWSPESRCLISGGDDGVLREWDADTREIVQEFPKAAGAVKEVAISADGRYVAAGISTIPLTVVVWDRNNAEAVAQLVGLNPTFAPDSHSIYVVNKEVDDVRRYSLLDGKELSRYGSAVYGFLPTADGRFLVTQDLDNRTLRVLRSDTGAEVGKLPLFETKFSLLALAPDGRSAFILPHDSTGWASFGSVVRQIRIPVPLPDDARDAPEVKTQAAPPPAIAPFDAQQAKTHQEAWAKHLGTEVEVTNSLGMKLRLIPPGEFLMGSTLEEIEKSLTSVKDYTAGYNPIQAPQHGVRLTKAFYLGSCEVTQRQYQDLIGVNPSGHAARGTHAILVRGLDTREHPVESVSWSNAIDFCNNLSQKEGLPPYYARRSVDVGLLGGTGYRLPTEAEWEFACRAGTTTRWSFGDDVLQLPQHAWFIGNSLDRPHRVGELLPDPFGLHDLYGNVNEWCWDWYGEFPSECVTDPLGPNHGQLRVARGSAFNYKLSWMRSAARTYDPQSSMNPVVGFRVARTIDTETSGGNAATATDGQAARNAEGSAAVVEAAPPADDPKWAEHTQRLPFVIGYEKGLAEAKAKDKPLMLFVTTTWCGWCTKLAQENFNDETVKALLGKFVLVIVDGDTEPEALAALEAKQGFPHLIFQSAAGQRLAEQVGYAPVDVFTKVVDDALAKAGPAAPQNEVPTPPEGTDGKAE